MIVTIEHARARKGVLRVAFKPAFEPAFEAYYTSCMGDRQWPQSYRVVGCKKSRVHANPQSQRDGATKVKAGLRVSVREA